jgi:gamma-glutamyltranspeptidase/glutathione hydrolase
MNHKGVIAAGHPATVEAGRLMLASGGNAFDAALAALCAACVAEPVLASPGGGGFLVAHRGGRSLVYDFFAQTPGQRRPRSEIDFRPILADFGGVHQEFHIGMGAIATPGFVGGLFAAHRDLATIPLRRLVEPAVELGRQGVVMNDLQAYLFSVVGPILESSSVSRQVYGSRAEPGRLLGSGELWRAPELADALELLAVEGQRLFYEGEIGQLLVHDLEQHGGYLTMADLAAYEVQRREPLTLDYQGVRVQTNPPPSCGGILIAFALRLLEGQGLGGYEPGSVAHLRLLAEVMALTNKARVESGLANLDSDQQQSALLDPSLLMRYRDRVANRKASLSGTTHISVLDSDGNAASLTVSNGEGTGYLIPGTGIMMNNMLGEEDINPYGFHCWPTNSRIASMMSPTLLLWPDGRIVALGSGGSNRIRTAVLQVLLNRVDFGLDLERAVQMPRIHHEDGFLNVEGGAADSVTEVLTEFYPDHRLWADLNLFFGGAHSVEQAANGDCVGVGDPRRGGAWSRAG